MGISWWHILIVFVVFVLLFGAGRISSLMSDVAKGLKSFKKEMADEDDDERSAVKSAGSKSTRLGTRYSPSPRSRSRQTT